MKKTILSISLFALAGTAAMFITSCSKDNTAPVISLLGSSTETVNLGDTYVDLGATATDDKDGSVTVTTSGTVDESTEGTYTLTYSASDKAGNSSSETRTVNVVIVRNSYTNGSNAAYNMTSGTLTVSGFGSSPETPYGTSISNSSTSTDVIFSTFGGTSGANIRGTLSGALTNGAQSLHTISIGVGQTFIVATYPVTITSGSGTLNSKGEIISLTWAADAGGGVTVSATESFSKQ